ncbi:MAG: guanylate kinase, partial [Ruminiclostridium sp.]|nr:guanylate kinase [Ruminiclostridium sp.]
IFPECVMIFILPPSIAELDRRLRKRGTETEETIAARIAQAKNELLFADKFDFLVVNGDLAKAVNDVNTVILSEKMASQRNLQLLEEIKNS